MDMEQSHIPEYITPRPFVRKYPIFSERTLRKMIAEGKVPGIQTAHGFKINVSLFLAQLDTMSMNNAAGGAAL